MPTPNIILEYNYLSVLEKLKEYSAKGKYLVTRETAWLTTIVYSQTYLRHGYISHPNHMIKEYFYSVTPSEIEIKEFGNNTHFADIILSDHRVSKDYYAHLAFGDMIEFHDNYFMHIMNSTLRKRKDPSSRIEGNTIIKIYTLYKED